MFSTARVLAAAAVVGGALAVPSLAAEADSVPARGERREPVVVVARELVPQLVEAKALNEPRSRPGGPFLPMLGEPDLGTAENAFGAARSGHVHSGHDLFAATGTPLVAVADGVVVEAGSDSSQGNYVYLYDPRRERTYVYMHMAGPSRAGTGERVKAGERLSGLGCTGSCYGDHLHFEIRAGRGITGEASDPLPELREWERLERPR